MSVAEVSGRNCSRCGEWKAFAGNFRRSPEERHHNGGGHKFGYKSECNACRFTSPPIARDRMLKARERAVQIFHLHDYGMKWAEIGRRLGMSRERARQLGNTGEIITRMRARRELGIVGEDE